MKIGKLKGRKNIARIECSCGHVWIPCSGADIVFDREARRRFIKEHAEHDLKLLRVTSTVFRA